MSNTFSSECNTVKGPGERNQDAGESQAMSHAEGKAEKENSEEHISCAQNIKEVECSGELTFCPAVFQGGTMTGVVG